MLRAFQTFCFIFFIVIFPLFAEERAYFSIILHFYEYEILKRIRIVYKQQFFAAGNVSRNRRATRF
jgi:hypothetical protein